MSDYKDKYLKYKTKYNELKKELKKLKKSNNLQKGGNDTIITEYRKKLEKLYPSIVFDGNNNNSNNSQNNTTYGEMNYDGITMINDKFNTSNQFDTFIDIGSGRGKLVLWYAVQPNINNSIGIEIVESRHKDAIKLKEQLGYPDITKSVQFICKDFADINFSSLIKPNSRVLIWMSNLCFSPTITDKIFSKIIKDFPKGTVICCSKETSNTGVTLIEKITVPMSWTSNSNVYVYRL